MPSFICHQGIQKEVMQYRSNGYRYEVKVNETIVFVHHYQLSAESICKHNKKMKVCKELEFKLVIKENELYNVLLIYSIQYL